MRTIFIADAHLQQPEDKNYRQMLLFLESLQGNTTTLCILGDLFDFRIGLPALDFPEHRPLLEALGRLTACGTRLIWLEGNHDFHLGRQLAEQTGAEIYPKPVQLELHGKQVMLCHGDLINRADWRYRLLYHTLRNRLLLGLARLLPAATLHWIRKQLQQTSKKRYQLDSQRWNYRQIIKEHSDIIRASGCDALVLGHFHTPFLEQDSDFTLAVLGDWIDQFSYLQLDRSGFSLMTWTD